MLLKVLKIDLVSLPINIDTMLMNIWFFAIDILKYVKYAKKTEWVCMYL